MNETTRRHEFRILGPLEVEGDGGRLDPGGPRQRALLALLLLNANRALSRERIADALWGDDPPASARNALQVAVHGLRKTLGSERVSTEGTGYRLVVAEDELDLTRFGHLVDRAAHEPAVVAAETLREALALWQGEALADLSDVPFVAVERERLAELQLDALERRIEADLQRGPSGELVAELEALIARHPFRERFRGQLMLALYRSGRQADALQAYRDARQMLVEELGVEPSRELQELEARILRQDPGLEAPAEAPERPRTNLPTPARPLVGRALEVAAVTALLRTPTVRLVTLTGPGGTGKTRLALEAAHDLLADFSGGDFLVDLAPIRDHALVAPTLARAVGVTDTDQTHLVERIRAAVGERDTLLLVDNFEHVLDAAPFVAELLSRVTRLRILATSREALRVAFEHEYRVPPLTLPPQGAAAVDDILRADAVAFFVSRARAALTDFELSEENAAVVVDICHALDGLPLALELAAARVRLVSTTELRDRIENRLGLLADGPRDLPHRQRTLRSTIDWSYDLLDEDEQRLLARLAVFAGGWTLDAAESVCDADISRLGSLVEKSLVRSQTDARHGARFSMLETVREYSLERLTASGELDEIRNRHAAYYGDLAVRLQPILERPTAVDEAEREQDNIRIALDHTLDRGDGQIALRLCMIARLWYAHGYLGEGSSWIERALTLGRGDPVIRARVLYYGAAIAWSSGDYERAVAYGLDGLQLAREVGDEMAETGSLMALGLAHQGTRDFDKARDFYRLSLESARASGDERWVAVALVNIADIEVTLRNYDEADELVREGLEIHRRIGEVEGTGVALLVLASSLFERGRDAEAAPLVVDGLSCFRRVGYKDFLVSALVALARARVADDPAHAARLLGAARTLRAPLGPAQFLWEHDWAEGTDEKIQELLGASRADTELARGANAPWAVVDEVLAEPASDPAS